MLMNHQDDLDAAGSMPAGVSTDQESDMSSDEAGLNKMRAVPDGTPAESITVPPQLDRVADVRGFIDSLGLENSLPPERVFDLKVAVSEAVANAIEHAAQWTTVRVWTQSDRVVVEVGNQGCFVSGQGAPPQDGPVRGFGLRIMLSLADEVAFSGLRRGKTNVRLTFLRDDVGGSGVARASAMSGRTRSGQAS